MLHFSHTRKKQPEGPPFGTTYKLNLKLYFGPCYMLLILNSLFNINQTVGMHRTLPEVKLKKKTKKKKKKRKINK